MTDPLLEDFTDILNQDLDWQFFSNKTILITGVNGFTPSSLTTFFLQLHDQKNINLKIIGLGRSPCKIEHKALKIIVQDICTPINLSEPVDIIIHAASKASPVYFAKHPIETLSPNLLGTINLLKFTEKNKINNFIFLSSGTVYGQFEHDDTLLQEDSNGSIDPFESNACYTLSKKMAENICYSWFKEKNTPIKIARLFHTIGPRMQLNDGRIHSNLIKNILHNETLAIKSNGKALRSFIDINDVISALLFIILKGSNGEAYNIGNPANEISIKGFAELLKSLSNKEDLIIDIQNQLDEFATKNQRYNVCINKLKTLGWYPKVSLNSSINKVLHQYEH